MNLDCNEIMPVAAADGGRVDSLKQAAAVEVLLDNMGGELGSPSPTHTHVPPSIECYLKQNLATAAFRRAREAARRRLVFDSPEKVPPKTAAAAATYYAVDAVEQTVRVCVGCATHFNSSDIYKCDRSDGGGGVDSETGERLPPYCVFCDIGKMEPDELYNRYNMSVCHANANTAPLLTAQECLMIERATRGQTANPLWMRLRENRETASGSEGRNVNTEATQYGVDNEARLKSMDGWVERLTKRVENYYKLRVVSTVLDCGMYISPMKIYSASPDAVLVLENGRTVIVEIKCPFTYRNTSTREIADALKLKVRLGGKKTEFNVDHVALKMDVACPANPVFRINRHHTHYRQMQHQMYVVAEYPFRAVGGVYVVLFGNDEVHMEMVPPDEEVIKRLHVTERARYEAVKRDNKRNRNMFVGRTRLCTLAGMVEETRDGALALRVAAAGLYVQNDRLCCAFCMAQCEMLLNRDYLDKMIVQHAACDSGQFNDLPLEGYHRPEMFFRCLRDPVDGDRGYYDDDGVMRTFCCGTTAPDHPTHCPIHGPLF